MTRTAQAGDGSLDTADSPLHGLFLRVPLPILLCDRRGRVSAVNDAYAALFSRFPIEGLDLLGDALFATRGLDDVVRRCLEGESSTSVERRYDAHETRGPHEPIRVIVEALPLFDAEKTVSHAALLFHDRTHRARETPSSLERILSALPRLSHDLRSPLNAILGFAEILYERQVEPDSPMHQEFLGDIIESGRRMLELVNDFDTLARAQSEVVSDEGT